MLEQQANLETHALTKEYKGFVVVKAVHLRFEAGKIHALISPKGKLSRCKNLFLRDSRARRSQQTGQQ